MDAFKTLEKRFNEKIDKSGTEINTLLGTNNENNLQAAEQFRRAIQIFVADLSDEQALEISTVYPKYEIGKAYKTGDRFTEGINGVGDAQLYKVVQDHISQADWHPSNTPSLYKAIGVTEDGYDEWSAPTGAHDTYSIGDIVSYQGTLYISTVDGNAYAPGVVNGQWIIYEG